MELLTGKTYGAEWAKVGNSEKFSQEELNSIKRIEVVNTKDSNGNVLDKLSLAIYVGNKGEHLYKPVDKNSSLKAGDAVDPASVTAQEYTDGTQKCIRFDGKAL